MFGLALLTVVSLLYHPVACEGQTAGTLDGYSMENQLQPASPSPEPSSDAQSWRKEMEDTGDAGGETSVWNRSDDDRGRDPLSGRSNEGPQNDPILEEVEAIPLVQPSHGTTGAPEEAILTKSSERKDLRRSSDKVSEGERIFSPSGRSKRKVISRVGHYIVRSHMGSSPWSSTGTDGFSSYKANQQPGYGWNPRGRIGDGGVNRPSSYVAIERRSHGRRATRKKLSKPFKGEIAQFAMRYGTTKASEHYLESVGRRLRDRVIEKFIQRRQAKLQKKRKKKKRSHARRHIST